MTQSTHSQHNDGEKFDSLVNGVKDGSVDQLTWITYFKKDLIDIADWVLRTMPKENKQFREDAVSEGNLWLLETYHNIKAETYEVTSDTEGAFRTTLYWVIHNYICGEAIGSQANYQRYADDWKADGFELPEISHEIEDRLQECDGFELVDMLDMIESCCADSYEWEIVKACVENPMVAVAETFGIHRKTVAKIRNRVFDLVEKKLEALNA